MVTCIKILQKKNKNKYTLSNLKKFKKSRKLETRIILILLYLSLENVKYNKNRHFINLDISNILLFVLFLFSLKKNYYFEKNQKIFRLATTKKFFFVNEFHHHLYDIIIIYRLFSVSSKFKRIQRRRNHTERITKTKEEQKEEKSYKLKEKTN